MATNTQFIFSIIVFYGILGVLLGAYGNTLYDVDEGAVSIISNLEEQKADAGIWETIWLNISIFSINAFSWLLPVFVGIGSLPFWFNAILFGPLFAIMVWTIIITLVPFFNDA